jgi:hypothetical protein
METGPLAAVTGPGRDSHMTPVNHVRLRSGTFAGKSKRGNPSLRMKSPWKKVEVIEYWCQLNTWFQLSLKFIRDLSSYRRQFPFIT